MSGVPRLIFISTGMLFVAGIAAAAAWTSTGDIRWLHLFFNYPGWLFLLGCGSLELWLGFRCWRQFSPGDLLRPAWLLITIAALLQLSAAVPIRCASEWGELAGPLYMVFLACGLFYVLSACRRIGVLGQLKTVDFVLLGVVLLYTLIFFVTVVFSPHRPVGLFERLLAALPRGRFLVYLVSCQRRLCLRIGLSKPGHAARHARTRRLRENVHPQRGNTSTKTNAFAPNSNSK